MAEGKEMRGRGKDGSGRRRINKKARREGDEEGRKEER